MNTMLLHRTNGQNRIRIAAVDVEHRTVIDSYYYDATTEWHDAAIEYHRLYDEYTKRGWRVKRHL